MDLTTLKIGDIVYHQTVYKSHYIVVSLLESNLRVINMQDGLEYHFVNAKDASWFRPSALSKLKYKNLYLNIFYGIEL
jgi:hypothetical protein